MNWKSINLSEAFLAILLSEAFLAILLFSIAAATAWLLFYIPVFIVLFLFGTWDIATKYTAIVDVIPSSIFALALVIHENKKKKLLNSHSGAVEQAIKDLNFDIGKYFQNGGTTLIMNPSFTEILYVSQRNSEPLIIHPENIIDMALEIDETIISKSSSGVGSSLAGAALGGALLGGTGAIVGAISGKSPTIKSDSGVRQVAIKIVVDDPENPLITMYFLLLDAGFDKASKTLQSIIEDANEWWACLKIFMNKSADKQTNEKPLESLNE